MSSISFSPVRRISLLSGNQTSGFYLAGCSHGKMSLPPVRSGDSGCSQHHWRWYSRSSFHRLELFTIDARDKENEMEAVRRSSLLSLDIPLAYDDRLLLSRRKGSRDAARRLTCRQVPARRRRATISWAVVRLARSFLIRANKRECTSWKREAEPDFVHTQLRIHRVRMATRMDSRDKQRGEGQSIH